MKTYTNIIDCMFVYFFYSLSEKYPKNLWRNIYILRVFKNKLGNLEETYVMFIAVHYLFKAWVAVACEE